MGYYIETPSHHHKADWIKKHFNLQELTEAPAVLPERPMLLVCVVENGPFDAAAVAFDEKDLWRFTRPTDDRPKRWLLIDSAVLLKYQPNAAKYLNPVKE